MSDKYRSRRIAAAAAVAELAAEVRREDEGAPERVASMERWRRKQDEPARRHHANGILALRCYVEACGYDFETAHPVLSAALAAADGADFEVTRPDWLMGLYLRGGTNMAADAARLDALPARDNEKLKLARAWKRAFADFQAEQERTHVVSLRRVHGSMRAGKKVASKLHVLCAQDLAEIERSPARRGRKRLEGFALAAHAQVEIIKRDPSRFCQPTPKPDPQPRSDKAPSPPANRRAVFLAKLDKLALDLLAAEVAEGATEEELDELRAAAHAQIEERFADALGADLSTSYIQESGGQNPAATSDSAAESDAPLLGADAQNVQQKHDSGETLVDKSVHQSDPGEAVAHELVACLFTGGRIGSEEALDMKSRVHEEAFRRALARRFSVEEIEAAAARDESRRGPEAEYDEGVP